MRTIQWPALGLVLGLLGATTGAGAQTTPPSNDPAQAEAQTRRMDRSACIDALPASAFAPADVFLVVDTPFDTAARRALPAARELAREAAEGMRRMFAAEGERLGLAEPRVIWWGAYGSLTVWVHPDGRFGWHDRLSDSVETAGLRVLASVLTSIRDSGGRLSWPPSVTEDSVKLVFRLYAATVDRTGRLNSVAQEGANPVFRVLQPWIEWGDRRSGSSRPRYPLAARKAGATAKLQFSAVTDTTGRVDTATVKLIAHEDQPGQAALLLRYYDEFVKSVKAHYARARFVPTRIGGCLSRRAFLQVFEFRIP